MTTTISNIIPAALGLILIYYALAQIVSAVANQVSTMSKMRTRELASGLRDLLDNDQYYWDSFSNHSFIQSLNIEPRDDRFTAEYIPSDTFSATLLDVVRSSQDATSDLVASIQYLPDGDLKTQLSLLVEMGTDRIDDVRDSIEEWFDNKMDVVTAICARKIKAIVALLGIVLVIATNADTIQIWSTFWTSPALQAAAAAQVDRVLEQESDDPAAVDTATVDTASIITELAEKGLPFFWTRQNMPDPTLASWALKASGLLITWLAVQLGAPFWYNVLRNLRGASTPASDEDES